MNNIKMNKYNNSKIYKLTNKDYPDLLYIGSTTQRLSNRLATHKYHNKIGRNNGNIKKLFQSDNVKIELLESYCCNSKEELLLKENEYINNNDCINIHNAITNPQIILEQKREYFKNNREKILESNRKSRLKNIEKIKEHRKRRGICECGIEICLDRKSRHIKTQKHIDLMKKK